jgi:hypothetical protein
MILHVVNMAPKNGFCRPAKCCLKCGGTAKDSIAEKKG